MAKKAKNSNYITEKTKAANAEKQKQQRNKKIKKNLIAYGGGTGVILLIAAVIVGLGFGLGWFSTNYTVTHHASIEVEGYGTIHVELYGEEAFETVNNFVSLAESGFYDGLTFHRLVEGFMAQGGDPNGDGSGGSENTITGEFSANGFENNIKHKRGVISMARGDDFDSASSQFFIVQERAEHLDGYYAAFGMVIDGMEIIDEIVKGHVDGPIPADQQPVIKSISIHAAH